MFRVSCRVLLGDPIPAQKEAHFVGALSLTW